VKEHGLKKANGRFPTMTLRDLFRYYTREAGVRNLERELANLARKAVKEMATKSRTSVRYQA
jgi:ATP-dependent Lon protease